MAIMLAKLYAALKSAGAPEDSAAAAEEVAGFQRLANLEAGQALIKWMVGFNLVLTMVIFGKILSGH